MKEIEQKEWGIKFSQCKQKAYSISQKTSLFELFFQTFVFHNDIYSQQWHAAASYVDS